MMQLSTCLIIVLCSVFVTLSRASAGDAQPYMQECRLNCQQERDCDKVNNAFDKESTFWLKLFGWDCSADCAYQCMTSHNALVVRAGTGVLKYHGKWPFVRVLGMQEFFSAVFSIGNIIPNMVFFFKYKSRVPDDYYLKKMFLLYAISNMITWTFSAIFHARDVRWTEALDYYFADLAWAFTCTWTTIRVFDLRSPISMTSVVMVFGGILVYLVYYLTFINFDYGYNTLIGISMGAWQSSLWYFWAFKNWKKK